MLRRRERVYLARFAPAAIFKFQLVECWTDMAQQTDTTGDVHDDGENRGEPEELPEPGGLRALA